MYTRTLINYIHTLLCCVYTFFIICVLIISTLNVVLILKRITMLRNISNLGSVLNTSEQKSIHGGLNPGCPVNTNPHCFSGPFYCNVFNLPICSPLDENN